MMVRYGTGVEGAEKIATAALPHPNSTMHLLPEHGRAQRICFRADRVQAALILNQARLPERIDAKSVQRKRHSAGQTQKMPCKQLFSGTVPRRYDQATPSATFQRRSKNDAIVACSPGYSVSHFID
jgi:hypothetical protein